MSTFESFKHGQFSWTDLMTPDAAASRSFYSELFGWGAIDNPTDQGGVYTQFTCKNRHVAGMGEQPPEMKSAGVPALWNSYVTVNDVDEIVGRVKGAGGTVEMPPMDVMTAGRMAIFSDPSGARFSVWQAGEHIGAGLCNEPVSMSWNELVTKDVEGCTRFYTSVFGWKFRDAEGAVGGYQMIENDGDMNGGLLPMPAEMGDTPPHWMVYFAVDDCDATIARAEQMGARKMAGPVDIEPGRFAVLVDSLGGAFSVIRLAQPE